MADQIPTPEHFSFLSENILCNLLCTFGKIILDRSNWFFIRRLQTSISALGRLKNHKIPQVYHCFKMYISLNRLQLKMYAIFVTFHAFSKHPLLMWIRIGANLRHKLYTFAQINWTLLRFYSVCLSKNFKFAHWGFWLVVQNYTFEIKQQWGLVVQ